MLSPHLFSECVPAQRVFASGLVAALTHIARVLPLHHCPPATARGFSVGPAPAAPFSGSSLGEACGMKESGSKHGGKPIVLEHLWGVVREKASRFRIAVAGALDRMLTAHESQRARQAAAISRAILKKP